MQNKTISLSFSFYYKLLHDHKKFIGALMRKHGSVLRTANLFKTIHFFADPAYIKHILFDNYHNYAHPANPLFDGVFGFNEIDNRDVNEKWLSERVNLLNIELNKKGCLRYVEDIVNNTKKKLLAWDKYVTEQKPIDIHG